jgi:hypothetical protein
VEELEVADDELRDLRRLYGRLGKQIGGRDEPAPGFEKQEELEESGWERSYTLSRSGAVR